jgi:hypothetical protein
MDRWRNVRNAAIVIALGAAVYYIPGGGHVAAAFEAALVAGFAIAISYLGLRLYRENQFALSALGDRHRAILYFSIALGFFCWMARVRMWHTSFGELVWFILVGIAAWGLIEVYRHSRSYS